MNQQDLSNLIKKTHSNLREKVYHSQGRAEVDEIWSSHVEELFNSEEPVYAEAMETLATQIWDERNHFPVNSRLIWIKKHIDKYFVENWMEKFVLRLKRKMSFSHSITIDASIKFMLSDRISILDVGSCYNPLSEVSNYDIVAIDLSPAPGSDTVYQCDFVSVKIEENTEKDCSRKIKLLEDSNRVESLFKESFDCVVFCLLLEYLPCPSLRFKVCQNAYKVLKNHGLLVIITPDSSHCGKNIDQIRCWQIALANLGFLRIFVDKLTHLRCLAFVKVDKSFEKLCHDEISTLTEKMSKVSESPFLLSDYDKLMFIRQDNSTKERMKSVKESQEDSNVSTGHLPQDIVDKFMNIDVD